MSDAIDTTTLGWIKPELDETLRQARQEIEAFAEAPTLTERMRACANHLHQVHGTLRMVELNAPAMIAEEMERLALALQHGEIAQLDEACAVLMRGVVQLPDYLERLQG
ncbi:MAG: Hpt domain-containing protein, partial [Pseudomonadota bacterium]|nr:Hpt domain-containing protein [Pseudomonadota bacterium]